MRTAAALAAAASLTISVIEMYRRIGMPKHVEMAKALLREA